MSKKGQKYRHWTAEEKYKIIKPILNFEKTSGQVTRETGLSNGMLCNWANAYKNNGLEGLKPKKKPGNPMAKYYSKKHFDTKEEQLEYENMKLRIENELLKKGYLMKGDGTLVTFKNKNK